MRRKKHFRNKKSCNIAKSAKISPRSIIYENNHIGKNVIIEDDVILLSNNFLENCIVKRNSIIGPYCRIRPKSEIGEFCKIGNFVEIKNSTIGNGTKIAHLTYVGDAIIGENCNIGCGVVFCNYNGKEKNTIVVKNNSFIGSNVNLIAPLVIGNNCYICAGTTVTKNLNDYDFAIGRSEMTIKENRAKVYLK